MYVDGSALEDITVVVLAWLTISDATPELELKLESPGYDTVMVLFPAELDESEQLPTAIDDEHWFVPSLTVANPVGLPDPGGFAVTVNDTAYVCPTAGDEGKMLNIVVVVLPLLTICERELVLEV